MKQRPEPSVIISVPGEAAAPRPTHARSYWALQILGWGAYCFGYYVVVLVPFREAGLPSIFADIIYCFAGLLATHLLRARIRAGRWTELPLLRLLPRLLAAALLVGLFQALALDTTLWFEGVFATTPLTTRIGILLATVFFSALLIGLWLAIYFVVQSSRRRRSAEVDALRSQVLARESQMRSLQQQLNPHFLFNCLNSLRGMIDEDPRRAQVMVTELAALLRAALRSDHCATVPLSDELAAVDAYIRLESVRLEERLRIHREIDPAATTAAVPPLLLQGLVENAVRHGIAPLQTGGDLTLRIARVADRLQVTVTNSGTLQPGPTPGTGLSNARERLRLLYGDRARLDLREDPPASVQATLEIPFEPAPQPSPVPQEAACAP